MQQQLCQSCGMQMLKPSDYPEADVEKNYCVNCSDANGNLMKFDERKEKMIHFVVSNMGVSQQIAEQIVLDTMSRMPLWKAYFR